MAILAPPPWKPDQSVIVKPRYFYSSRRWNIFDIFFEPVMIIWKRSVGLQPIQLSSQLPPHTVSSMLGTPLPIRCTNCHDKQLMCEAVITALLMACHVYSHPIPFSGMDFPTHFVFSAIAFIAHKVTKNAYSTTLILHCNANIV